MDLFYVGILGTCMLVALIMMGVPVAYSLAGVGTLGLVYINGIHTVLAFIPMKVYTQTAHFTLAAIPLFILMGYLAFHAEISTEAYNAARSWVGAVPGGLAVTTVYACAIFGACAGSSLAECAVFSRIAVPEMLSSGYNRRLAFGKETVNRPRETVPRPCFCMIQCSEFSRPIQQHGQGGISNVRERNL